MASTGLDYANGKIPVLFRKIFFPTILGMGVKGGAIATAGSVAVGGVMAIVYFRWSYVIKLAADFSGFRRNIMKTIAVGSASFITEIAMSIMMLTGNFIFMRYFGDAGVAAYSIIISGRIARHG